MPAIPSDHLPTPSSLWRAEAGLRRTLAEAAWEEAGLRDDLIRIAARHFHMREQSLRPRAAGVERVQKLPQLPDDLALDLCKNYLFKQHRPLLRFFLDHLGLSHDDGELADSPPPPDAARLQAAVAALRKPESGFDAALVRLYLSTLHASDLPSWGGLAPFLAEEAAVTTPPSAALAAPPARPGTKSDAMPPLARAEEHFTTLDRVVMRTIVAGVSDIEGALSAIELQKLVEEMGRLNPARHRSYFHMGFLHALQRRTLQRAFAGANPDRRRWYLAGAVAGYAREEDWAAIITLFQAGELTGFGRQLDEQSREATPWIVEALIQTGMPAPLAEFLDPPLIGAIGAFDKLFQYARILFQQGRLAETEAILDLLGRARLQPAGAHDTPLQEVERLRAHCLQWQGRLEPALAILNHLRDSPSLDDRAAVLTDVAMAQHGLRGLFDVQLRDPSQNQLLQGQLKAMRPQLEEAARAPGRQGHARFCLGVLELLSERHLHAAAHLDAAHAAFQQANPLYRHFELPQRCQFYLAVALLGSIEPGSGDRALELLDSALAAGFRPPVYLLRVAALLAMVRPQPPIEALAEIVVSRLGETALDNLIDLEGPPCAPLLHRLLQRGQDAERGTEARMKDLLLVVRQAPAADASGMQAQALDALEELARRLPAAAATGDFLGLLEDETAAAFDPAWETSDAIWAAAELRDLRSEPAKAADLLLRLGFRLLHEGGYGAADEARELARRAQGYGADVQQLQARIEAGAAAVDEQAPTHAGQPVRVLVVGGDEQLTAIGARIQEQLRDLDPQISVKIEATHWSSNWGRQFDRLKPSLSGYPAIVVLRRIRTQLGRLLRREHSCWVGCAGDSPAAIVRAVVLAAELARGGGASRRAQAGVD